MPTTTVKLNEFADILRDMPSKTFEEVKTGVISGVARSIPDLVAASPVDQGFYAASWNFSVEEHAVILGNTSPHASIIEDGARPFTPPIGPLLAWAKRVLQDSSQPPNYSEAVRGLAFGVQKKIAANGMKPKKILENMIPKIIENIKAELDKT